MVIMPHPQHSRLLEELGALDVETTLVGSCQAARALLEKRPRVDLVISDLSLPDGNWYSVLKHLVESGVPAPMVVAATHADERLWSEVLWRGAYDLLVEPFDHRDIRRVVEGAVRAAGRRDSLARPFSTVAIPATVAPAN
jgi:DNA-binding NtrC family response regulator